MSTNEKFSQLFIATSFIVPLAPLLCPFYHKPHIYMFQLLKNSWFNYLGWNRKPLTIHVSLKYIIFLLAINIFTI